MTSRGRYPSYSSSDGISYPTQPVDAAQHHVAPSHHHHPAHQFATPLSAVPTSDAGNHWNDPPPLSPKKRGASFFTASTSSQV